VRNSQIPGNLDLAGLRQRNPKDSFDDAALT
jgi:hypothetical protein